MAVVLIIVGVILLIVALQGSAAQLAAELQADVTGYFKMGIGIAVVLALGYIPGLEKPSRWLFGLMLGAIVLKNYSTILTGLTQFAGGSGVAAAPAVSSSGTTGAGGAVAAVTSNTSPTVTAGTQAQAAALNPLDPSTYLTMFETGFGGASHP